jgi:quercetin dioxygenase-like cupin family protein
MSTLKGTRYRLADLPLEDVQPMLARRLITASQITLAHVKIEKGCVVPRHSHVSEQLTAILEGSIRFWLGEGDEDVVIASAGDVVHLPSLSSHKAEALETTIAFDLYSPARTDWLNDGAR